MKIKHLLLFLSIISTLSCSSCVKSDSVPPPTCSDSGCDINAHAVNLVKGDDWELVLPADAQNIDPPFNAIKVFASTHNGDIVLLFMKEEFLGTNDDYVFLALKGMKENGTNIVSVNGVKLNNFPFALIESEKNDMHLLTWTTVKNSNGYALSCAQPLNIPNETHICLDIAETLKIK